MLLNNILHYVSYQIVCGKARVCQKGTTSAFLAGGNINDTIYEVIFMLVYFHEFFKNWMSAFKFHEPMHLTNIAITFLQHFTNIISRIQNYSWNSWKFSGVKKTLYTVISYKQSESILSVCFILYLKYVDKYISLTFNTLSTHLLNQQD